MADLPQEELVPIKNRSVSGGVNTRLFALDIADNEAVELQNIDIQTPGQRVKRKGYTLTATGFSLGPIKGLTSFRGNGGDTHLLAVTPGFTVTGHQEVYKWDGTGLWTRVFTLTGYTANTECVFVAGHDTDLGGKVVVINPLGAMTVTRWFYTTNSAGTATFGATYFGSAGHPPVPEALAYINGRAYGTQGTSDGRASSFISKIAQWVVSPTAFPAADVFILGSGSTQKIVAITGFRNNEAIIYMDDRIEELIAADWNTTPLGVANWERRVIDPTIGCSSKKSVAVVGEDQLFADQFGNIRSLARTALDAQQGTRSVPVSDPIDSYIKRINAGFLSQIVAHSFDRWYCVGLPLDSAQTPDTVFLFDTVLKAWEGPWTNITPSWFTVGVLDATGANQADKNPNLYFGSTNTTTGYVFRMMKGEGDANPGSADTSIAFSETTKSIDYGVLDLDKQWIRIEVIAIGTASIALTVEANTGGGFVIVGSINLLGDAPTLPHGFPLMLGGTGVVIGKLSLEGLPRSRSIQFKFTGSSATDTIRLLGWNLFAFPQNITWDVLDPATQVL